MVIYAIYLFFIGLFSFIDVVKFPMIFRKLIYLLIVFCLVMLVGFRGEVGTDSSAYIHAFNSIEKITISHSEVNHIYSDIGFIFLSSLISFITNNYTVYFIILSVISFLFLYKVLIRVNKYFILGILVYYVRFLFLRDFNQMRAALAINVLLSTLLYIKEKKPILFCKSLFLSVLIHKSTAVWCICYKYAQLKISKQKTLILLGLGFIGSLIMFRISEKINSIFSFIGIPIAYITGEYGLGTSEGFTNPILYYQLLILFFYILLEKRIYKKHKYYFVLRNLYLAANLIFLIFLPWSSIAGRTSTIFATMEIFIIPSFLFAFKSKLLINVCLVLMLFFMAYINIFSRLGQEYLYFR